MLHALVQRGGAGWVVEVPEVEGLYTQAPTLDDVPLMVKDAAALLTGRPLADFDVEIVPAPQS